MRNDRFVVTVFAARVTFAACMVFAACITWPSRAATIDGKTAEYAARWAQYRREGVSVRIAGPCESECTMILGHVSRDHICVTPEARLGFRLAAAPVGTATLWKSYPTDIKAWVMRNGGLGREAVWLRAPEVYRFFRICDRT
jgi:hypothetical protein